MLFLYCPGIWSSRYDDLSLYVLHVLHSYFVCTCNCDSLAHAISLYFPIPSRHFSLSLFLSGYKTQISLLDCNHAFPHPWDSYRELGTQQHLCLQEGWNKARQEKLEEADKAFSRDSFNLFSEHFVIHWHYLSHAPLIWSLRCVRSLHNNKLTIPVLNSVINAVASFRTGDSVKFLFIYIYI